VICAGLWQSACRNRRYYLFRLDLDGDGYDFADLYYLAGDDWLSVDMPGSGQWDPEQI